MIAGKALYTFERFVAESKKSVSRPGNRFGRAVQIDVGLHAKSRVSRVTRPLCESFENQVLGTGTSQGISYKGVRFLEQIKPLGIVREIAINPRSRPVRKLIPADLTEMQRQMHLVAIGEQLSPLCLVQRSQ